MEDLMILLSSLPSLTLLTTECINLCKAHYQNGIAMNVNSAFVTTLSKSCTLSDRPPKSLLFILQTIFSRFRYLLIKQTHKMVFYFIVFVLLFINLTLLTWKSGRRRPIKLITLVYQIK